MSWLRATISGFAIVVVAFLALVYVPNLLLTKLTSLDRSTRVAVCVAWFTVALVGILYGLRRLQARRLI